MSDVQQISIPLKPHIKKFAIYHLGKTPDLASKKNIVGLLVYAMLENTQPGWKPSLNADALELKVHRRRAVEESRGLVITTKKVKLLEDMLDSMFKNELYSYVVINKLKYGVNKRNSIREYLQKMNITEQEMTLATCVKRIYRIEKALETA